MKHVSWWSYKEIMQTIKCLLLTAFSIVFSRHFNHMRALLLFHCCGGRARMRQPTLDTLCFEGWGRTPPHVISRVTGRERLMAAAVVVRPPRPGSTAPRGDTPLTSPKTLFRDTSLPPSVPSLRRPRLLQRRDIWRQVTSWPVCLTNIMKTRAHAH